MAHWHQRHLLSGWSAKWQWTYHWHKLSIQYMRQSTENFHNICVFIHHIKSSKIRLWVHLIECTNIQLFSRFLSLHNMELCIFKLIAIMLRSSVCLAAMISKLQCTALMIGQTSSIYRGLQVLLISTYKLYWWGIDRSSIDRGTDALVIGGYTTSVL